VSAVEPPSDRAIVVDKHDGVVTVWLNRPEKRNAITFDMWAEIADTVGHLGEDRSVRVLVVRGVGGAFCAGADISGLHDRNAMSYADVNRRAEEALASFSRPTVAFIDGPCIGGGVQLAMACDLRIGTTDARLGITPARLGILFPTHSLERVVRQVGPSAAKSLLFTAEIIGAEKAERMGLLDEVHSPRIAAERLLEVCAYISSRSAFTQQASKQMIDDAHVHGAIDPGLSKRWLSELALGEDSAEGVAAFLEHRAPAFTSTHTSTGG
jgi:enoyl-CoA hydratase/carnithine racemase